MKIRGDTRGQHYGKHSGSEENIRHEFSRARAKRGDFLGAGDKEVHGKGGQLLVDFWDHRCLSFTGIAGAYGDRRETLR